MAAQVAAQVNEVAVEVHQAAMLLHALPVHRLSIHKLTLGQKFLTLK